MTQETDADEWARGGRGHPVRNKCKEAERERRTQVREHIGTPRRRAIGKSSAPTTTMTIPRCRMMTDRAGLRSAKINPAPYNAVVPQRSGTAVEGDGYP